VTYTARLPCPQHVFCLPLACSCDFGCKLTSSISALNTYTNTPVVDLEARHVAPGAPVVDGAARLDCLALSHPVRPPAGGLGCAESCTQQCTGRQAYGQRRVSTQAPAQALAQAEQQSQQHEAIWSPSPLLLGVWCVRRCSSNGVQAGRHMCRGISHSDSSIGSCTGTGARSTTRQPIRSSNTKHGFQGNLHGRHTSNWKGYFVCLAR
jgi:hypothetical protein